MGAIELFSMDMHAPFEAAIRDAAKLKHAVIVHDPFHVMKRASEAVDELRRQVFFRNGPKMRALGRGKRWLFKRAWANCAPEQKQELGKLVRLNGKLASAYQLVEQLRDVLACSRRNHHVQGIDERAATHGTSRQHAHAQAA